MNAEQRARAWEKAADALRWWHGPMIDDDEQIAYIETEIIPHLHAKAESLRRKERAEQGKPFMTNLEIELAKRLFARCEEELSGHGCNDFEIPNSQEAIDLLNAMEQWNVGHGNTPDAIHTCDPLKKTIRTRDWYLLSYLSFRLLQCAEENKNKQSA